MSISHQKENNAFFGKSHTDDTKYKMRNKYLIDGQLYIGNEDVMDKFNISKSTIMNRCKSNKFENWIAIKNRSVKK